LLKAALPEPMTLWRCQGQCRQVRGAEATALVGAIRLAALQLDVFGERAILCR
jgi:hypothetical protein